MSSSVTSGGSFPLKRSFDLAASFAKQPRLKSPAGIIRVRPARRTP